MDSIKLLLALPVACIACSDVDNLVVLPDAGGDISDVIGYIDAASLDAMSPDVGSGPRWRYIGIQRWEMDVASCSSTSIQDYDCTFPGIQDIYIYSDSPLMGDAFWPYNQGTVAVFNSSWTRATIRGGTTCGPTRREIVDVQLYRCVDVP